MPDKTTQVPPQKQIVKFYPRSGKAKRVHTNRESVGSCQEKKTKNSIVLRSREENQNIKKIGQGLKTNIEISQNKNTPHTYCGYISRSEFVKILKSKTNKYHYNGTASCKMIWRCPSCAYKILKHRGQEIYKLASNHQRQNLKLGFVTLTTKHKKYDKLKTNNDKIVQDFRKFQMLQFFKKLRKNKLLGQVKAFEHTYTQKNGWHPHLHIIFFWNTESESEVNKLQKELIKNWATYTNGSIKAQNQKPIYSIGEISDYVTKWDSIQELTNTQAKNGKGKTPFQFLKMLNNNELLFDYTDLKKSNQKLKSLWLEYVEATKGNRRITISPKLNELYKVQSETDQQICDKQHEGKPIIGFTRKTWIKIFNENIQAYLINICYENESIQQQQTKIIDFIKQFDQVEISMEENCIIINIKTILNEIFI